jgi:hypothetical protein
MKYVDVPSLFEGDRSGIAFLATYQFDPDFFERRLLGCSALQKARRIVVFVDRSEWLALLRRDIHARYVNRRYLVVPVQQSSGSFHPKLVLLLSESGGRVLCGSNNLTRAGCSSNLELLNAVCFEFDGKHDAEIDVAKEAFGFFEQAVKHTNEDIARIANDWLQETARGFPWLRQPVAGGSRTMRLLHSYDLPLWQHMTRLLTAHDPREFFVISPFHNNDAELFHRFTRTWPDAKMEVLAQQGYTTLPVNAMKGLRKVRLSEILETPRRLHAKLVAWRHRTGDGCLIGSANFTCAAFDGLNVETCLLVTNVAGMIEALFDKELKKRPIALKDFEPGARQPPSTEDPSLLRLNIESAILADADTIRVTYSHNLRKRGSLALALRTAGERHPRISVRLNGKSGVSEMVRLPKNALTGASGALLANLVAEIDGESSEGPLVWVIQEDRLTYEPGEGGGTTKRRVEETGEGLHELLDEIGNRDGIHGVIDFLQHFNIQFFDGDANRALNRRFQISIRDPFQPDVAPEWLKGGFDKTKDLETAIMEFAERHERHRLRRHAKRGNVNGIENFLDIFTALVRILYVYAERGIVKREKLLGRLCRFIELATKGGTTLEGEPFDGYLSNILANLGRGSLLPNRCDDTNYLAVVHTALLIARRIRANGEKLVAKEFLPSATTMVEEVSRECGLRRPTHDKVREALAAYRMLPEEEIRHLLTQLD